MVQWGAAARKKMLRQTHAPKKIGGQKSCVTIPVMMVLHNLPVLIRPFLASLRRMCLLVRQSAATQPQFSVDSLLNMHACYHFFHHAPQRGSAFELNHRVSEDTNTRNTYLKP